jgi:HPt (histidine-containing phosphotransfer) domain-containing protein
MMYSLEKVSEMCGDDKNFVEDLTNTFLESLNETARMIELALEKGDRDQLIYWSHRIKSNLNLFNSKELEVKARTIEEWVGGADELRNFCSGFIIGLIDLERQIRSDHSLQ